MKMRWCWRCKMEMPMLDEAEFQLCRSAITGGKQAVLNELEKRNIKNYQWLEETPENFKKWKYFVEMYRLITGFIETNPNAIFHHVIDQYGADCPNCKKPLRTKQARFCAACGFGKEDVTGADTKPLMERRPELFD